MDNIDVEQLLREAGWKDYEQVLREREDDMKYEQLYGDQKEDDIFDELGEALIEDHGGYIADFTYKDLERITYGRSEQIIYLSDGAGILKSRMSEIIPRERLGAWKSYLLSAMNDMGVRVELSSQVLDRIGYIYEALDDPNYISWVVIMLGLLTYSMSVDEVYALWEPYSEKFNLFKCDIVRYKRWITKFVFIQRLNW